jgi:hypothetical protein
MASPASLLCHPPSRRRVTWGKFAPSLARALKNQLNLKTPAGAVFFPGHPPLRRRETYRPSMLDFTYEDDLTIK